MTFRNYLESRFVARIFVHWPQNKPMREHLHEGALLFNSGQWWEAHEAWETHWMQASGAERHYIQGLILLAAALHKRWVHGSLTARNFAKAQKHWAQLPRHYDGLDLESVQQEVWQALQQEKRLPQLPFI